MPPIPAPQDVITQDAELDRQAKEERPPIGARVQIQDRERQQPQRIPDAKGITQEDHRQVRQKAGFQQGQLFSQQCQRDEGI